jgi:curved DNA-binding protein CbpA
MPLNEALALFRRLGVHVESMSPSDFTLCYFGLARRYHPDRNPQFHELMANINAARATILQTFRRAR